MLTAWFSHRKIVAVLWRRPCFSWGLHHHCLPGRGVPVWLARRLHWPAQRGCLEYSGTMPLPRLQLVSEPAGTARHLRLNRQGPRCHPWQTCSVVLCSFTCPGAKLIGRISGRVAEYIVAIDVTRARFPADAMPVALPAWQQRTLADGMAFPSQARCRAVTTAMF